MLKLLTLQKSHQYLRWLFNQKIIKNMTGLVPSLDRFKAVKAVAPDSADQLNLVQADNLIASCIKKTVNFFVQALPSLLTNQPEIFRLHRDMLYTSMSRKQRILSGVTQQLRKGYCNKENSGVYL